MIIRTSRKDDIHHQVIRIHPRRFFFFSTRRGDSARYQSSCIERTNLVCHIIHDNDSMCSTVVTWGYSAETFLTSGIPLQTTKLPSDTRRQTVEGGRKLQSTHDLKLDRLPIQFYCSNFLKNKREEKITGQECFKAAQKKKATYEVDTNGTDVTLCVGIVLRNKQPGWEGILFFFNIPTGDIQRTGARGTISQRQNHR